MKIGVFAYNFPHYKSQQGLFRLFFNNIKPDVIFLQNWRELNLPTVSKIRVLPRYTNLLNTKEVAYSIGIKHVVEYTHDKELIHTLRSLNLDLGIILGSRMLSIDTINMFGYGIINIHPGILPHNRGLDNIVWAVIKDYRQGVTSHLIDENVDFGCIIEKRHIQVEADDTFLDIGQKIIDLGLDILYPAIKKVQNGNIQLPLEKPYAKNKPFSDELDMLVLKKFEAYKLYYKYLV
jgi:methionyl-tRNA formyltransferase